MKFLLLAITLIFSVNLSASLSGKFTTSELNALFTKANNQLILSKFIKKLEKKGLISLKLGEIKNTTKLHLPSTYIKDSFTYKLLQTRKFQIVASDKDKVILEKEKEAQLKASGDKKLNIKKFEVKADFIIKGVLSSEVKTLEDHKQKTIFTFKYELLDGKSKKVVYKNKVFMENIVKIRKSHIKK